MQQQQQQQKPQQYQIHNDVSVQIRRVLNVKKNTRTS
jgi:hypothetical protein